MVYKRVVLMVVLLALKLETWKVELKELLRVVWLVD
jgi:hypothetical protein